MVVITNDQNGSPLTFEPSPLIEAGVRGAEEEMGRGSRARVPTRPHRDGGEYLVATAGVLSAGADIAVFDPPGRRR